MTAPTMTPLAGYLATGLYQLGYVTNDLERAVDELRATLGVGPVTVLDFAPDSERSYTYRGRPSASRHRAAMTALGPHHLEIVQPLAGESPYWEPLGEDYTLAFHHVGVRVADLDACRSAALAAGKEPVFEGGSGDAYRFFFTDCRPELGHMVEFTQVGPTAGAFLERVTRGEA